MAGFQRWGTLFSDASRCPTTGACGWAGSILRDGRRSNFQGQFRKDPDDIHEAELQAIAQVLWSGCKAGSIIPRGGVMIQSDSMSALQWILTKVPAATDRPFEDGGKSVVPMRAGQLGFTDNIRRAVEVIGSMVDDFRLGVTVRHVKGHRAGNGRSFINCECDKAAKEEMYKRRLALDVARRETSRSDRRLMQRAALRIAARDGVATPLVEFEPFEEDLRGQVTDGTDEIRL